MVKAVDTQILRAFDKVNNFNIILTLYLITHLTFSFIQAMKVMSKRRLMRKSGLAGKISTFLFSTCYWTSKGFERVFSFFLSYLLQLIIENVGYTLSIFG